MTRCGAFVLVNLAFVHVVSASPRYTVTDLGNLGVRQAYAYAINSAGHAVGFSPIATNQIKAFYWSPTNGMLDIVPPGNAGTLPTGTAYGINAGAQVVGEIRLDQNQPICAFLWSASAGFQQLGTLGGPDSKANDINNAGQVVGYTGVPSGAAHAFIWSAATGMRDIHTLGGNSEANAINEQGQVVGYTVINGYGHGFRWRSDTGMVNLGTLGGTSSEAFDINNDGLVVGRATTSENGGNFTSHAFVYDETGMHDLGHLGSNYSEAHAINDRGEIVGYSNLAGELLARAFYFDGSMHDLNALIDPASGWKIAKAFDINNDGVIAAVATRDTEPWAHAVLLTPVPEPVSGATLLLACIITWRRERNRRRG